MRLLSLLVLTACQPMAPVADESATERSTDAGTLIGDHWRARADRLEVRVDRATRTRVVNGVREVVIEGRVSRELDNIYSWVPDDLFGTAVLRGPMRFQADLDLGVELRSILSGTPLFVAMHTTTGRVQDYNAWIGLGAALTTSALPAGVQADRQIRPVFRRGDPDTLRYRATVTSPGAGALVVSASPGAEPEVHQDGDGRWTLDWTHAGLELAAAARTQVDIDGATFSVQPVIQVSSLGLTTEDPYNLWTSTCEPAVLSCLQSATGVDVAACGSWRQVSRCAAQDQCAYAPPDDLRLDPVHLGLETAAQDWNDQAIFGGIWGSVEAPLGWEHPTCLAEAAALEDIVALVIQSDQNFTGLEFGWGQVLDRDGLGQTAAFSSVYSPAGPALLAAIDGQMGSTEVVAWLGESEIPCPNCHEWQDLYVLYYPAVGQVVVLSATHGWDS